MDDQPRRQPQPEDRGRPGGDRAAAAARMNQQSSWVDLQIRQAIERGDFEDLPGYGKPLQLDARHDPDWWVKQLIEREQVTGVLPPSLQLRREDAELDARLDGLPNEAEVRREVGEFNDRVRWALYRPPEGPPVVTARRDPEREVERWRERRAARITSHRHPEQPGQPAHPGQPGADAGSGTGRGRSRRRRRAWWRRRP